VRNNYGDKICLCVAVSTHSAVGPFPSIKKCKPDLYLAKLQQQIHAVTSFYWNTKIGTMLYAGWSQATHS
jgi:hypothetical protein